MNMAIPFPYVGSYNRKQRTQINKAFTKIFREVQKQIITFQKEAEEGEELAAKMVEAYRKIKSGVNPSFDEKVEFLKTVAPNWEGV